MSPWADQDQEEASKIANANAGGLSATSGSLAYTIAEVEKHFHNKQVWAGKLGSQTETNWAEINGLTAFRCTSGDGDFGSDASDEAQVFGSGDSSSANGAYMDAGTVLIDSTSSTTAYVMRLVYGTGTLAAAISAGQYTTFMVRVPASSRAAPLNIQMPRVAVGTKIWMQCKNATDNATVDFYIGGHFYSG